MDEFKGLVHRFGYAIEGIVYTVKTQRNMQIHIGAACIALLMGWLLHIPRKDVLLVFFCIFLVFILELVNTAIEVTINLITVEFHPLAKIAKDVAAGAVLLAVVLALIVGAFVFVPPFMAWV